jgi:acetyl-CoA C-acetyltransferase
MSQTKLVLSAPVRTAIGTYVGSLKDLAAPLLGSVIIKETLSRAKIDGGAVDTVVMSQVVQAGAKMNPARQAAIKAGIPVSVLAMTINRVCGSGAQAIAAAAQEVMLGFACSAVAGGMENMDQSPYLMTGGRWGYRMGDAQIYDSMPHDGLNDAFCDQHAGWVTEDLVNKYQVSGSNRCRRSAARCGRRMQAAATRRWRRVKKSIQQAQEDGT